MAKRGEFERDAKYDFDPDEILDEESGTAEVRSDIPADESEDNITESTENLDELLSDEFLTMLGIEPAAREEADEPASEDLFEPVSVEEPIEEEYYEDNDHKDHAAAATSLSAVSCCCCACACTCEPICVHYMSSFLSINI